VGHGNCAVIRDRELSAVVDAPKTRVLPDSLDRHGVRFIQHLLLSHADEDHIGGAEALLGHPKLRVSTLWVNPNSRQYSATYIDLLTVARDKQLRGELQVCTNLNTGAGDSLSFGRVGIQLLHPDILFAGIGPTTGDHPLGPISSNGMSAVVRVLLDGTPAVLLPGDLDARSFAAMQDRCIDVTAPVLVFPHHGGSTRGGDDRGFARGLCEAVRPELVVFSLGRQRHRNPLPDVVAGIRDAAPSAHIACTQLSRRCHAAEQTPASHSHLLDLWPAAGHKTSSCCAGTILVRRNIDGIAYEPLRQRHQAFITSNVAAPLCHMAKHSS
jgi:beta-lactamase superfamily II metal-dependent hydrolase